MSATLIGAIYDLSTGVVLRIVVPDTDAQLALHVHAGEGIAPLSKAQYPTKTLEDIAAIVEVVSGKPQPPPKVDPPYVYQDGFYTLDRVAVLLPTFTLADRDFIRKDLGPKDASVWDAGVLAYKGDPAPPLKADAIELAKLP